MCSTRPAGYPWSVARRRRGTRSGRSYSPTGQRPRVKAEAAPERQAKPGTAAGAHALLETFLHPREPVEPRWRWLLPILAVAFVVRAAVALGGDFVLHPDEIMQYLEPAHRLVFDSGITYWEFYYGARSWLVPGLVAGVIKAFDAVGLGDPDGYVAAVKLTLCGISLAIPAAMYAFARRHFSETAARAALIAGALWYELAGFAHKPMTEFVATAPFLVLLAMSVRQPPPGLPWMPALLAVVVAAVRPQYAPLALIVLGVIFLRNERKTWLVLAALGLTLAVGLFDALTWDRGLFHSYITNVRFNLIVGELRGGESPAWQFLAWLTAASAGLVVLCFAGALVRLKRYAFLLSLIVVVLLIHSLQGHKEYRFVFVLIPLWLIIGADICAHLASTVRRGRIVLAASGGLFGAVSLAGILNALPLQESVYQAWSRETGAVRFFHGQDSIFDAYRFLANASGVGAVWQVDRPYYNTPGYYYLHHRVPFYDSFTGRDLLGGTPLSEAVTHLVSNDPGLAVPGYSLARQFGAVRVLARDQAEGEVRNWREYAPIIADEFTAGIVRRFDPEAPSPPKGSGIRFTETETTTVPD